MSGDLDLCYMTASEALAAFRARKLSPLDLMKAVIGRSEAVNPKLNAVTYSFFDRALDSARQAEARYQKGSALPLDGLPVAIKDFHPVKDEVTTYTNPHWA